MSSLATARYHIVTQYLMVHSWPVPIQHVKTYPHRHAWNTITKCYIFLIKAEHEYLEMSQAKQLSAAANAAAPTCQTSFWQLDEVFGSLSPLAKGSSPTVPIAWDCLQKQKGIRSLMSAKSPTAITFACLLPSQVWVQLCQIRETPKIADGVHYGFSQAPPQIEESRRPERIEEMTTQRDSNYFQQLRHTAQL